jgi:glucosamine--fructose-6-phosphate aminotransferase (isomerizing)
MCGIVGYVGQTAEDKWSETYRLINALLVAAEMRGKDATGFVAATEPFKSRHQQRIITDKQPIPSSRFVVENSAWRSLAHHRSIAVIGHTRLGTHGTSNNQLNLHPFSSSDRSLFLVHNGVVQNHKELSAKHGLRPLGECDSESLFGIVNKTENIADGFKTCLREVTGSMALAAYDHRKGQMFLARNDGSPMWLMRLRNDRHLFFASTAPILLTALTAAGRTTASIELFMPLAPWYVYCLTADSRFLTV